MRTLLFFSLVIIAAAGYIGYFNDTVVSVAVTSTKSYDVGLVTLLLGCLTAGLAMGLGGTMLRDAQLFFVNLSAKRRLRHTDRVHTLFQQAERERLAGRAAKARELYKKINKINPEYVPAISRTGDLARQKGAHKEAVSLHRLAFRLDPDDPNHRLSMIDDYMAMESYGSAVQLIEQVLAEDAKSQTLLMRLRDIHAKTGEWDAATSAQEQLIKTAMTGLDSKGEAATLAGFRYEAAAARLAAGKTERGKSILKEMVRQNSTFAPAYMSLGSVLMGEGKASEALALYRDAYEQTRDESFLPAIENLFIVQLEEPREAIRYFTTLVERDPKSLPLRYFLGRIYYRLEMIDDALHVLTQLEHQAGGSPAVNEMVGRISLRRGEVGEALSAFGEASPAVPYGCKQCGMGQDQWAPRCAACGQWGQVVPVLAITQRADTIPGETLPVQPARA